MDITGQPKNHNSSEPRPFHQMHDDTPPHTPTPSPEPAKPEKKPRRSKTAALLGALLALALIGAGVLGYMWYTSQLANADMQEENARLSEDKTQLQQELVALRANQTSAEQAPKTTADMQQVYAAILKNGHYPDEAEVTAVETALAEQKNVASVPEGTTVLAIYRIVKPGDMPSGDEYALVLWPAADEKPADFIEMVKGAGSDEWKVSELL